MRILFLGWIGLGLLASCESRPTAIASTTPLVPPLAAKPALVVPDTIDYTNSQHGALRYQASVDTLVLLGQHHYWLQLRQTADSSKPVDYSPTRVVGRYFAAPADSTWQHHRVRGYDGTYSFVLRDSTRQRVVFRQQLHKKDLLPGAPAETVTVSAPEFYYLGYSSGLQALLFLVEIGIPNSDVGHRAALLLDARSGRVRALRDAGSATFEATDCEPQIAPDGQAAITCADELLRAGRPAFSLRRPHAELRATRFLTDTTLLAVYAFGDYRPRKPEPGLTDTGPSGDPSISAGFYLPDQEFVSTPAQLSAANAFVLGTSGHVLGKFHFTNWGMGEMNYSLPRRFLAATRTYYFFNDKALVLLPKATPGRIIELPLKGLTTFSPPQQPQEVSFTLPDEYSQEEFTFYVDKTNPRAVRVRRQKM